MVVLLTIVKTRNSNYAKVQIKDEAKLCTETQIIHQTHRDSLGLNTETLTGKRRQSGKGGREQEG